MAYKMGSALINKLKDLIKSTDLLFLLFLLLVLNVSLFVKLAGVILIYLARPHFNFKQIALRLPLFYPLMALLTLCHIVINYNRGLNYCLLATLACIYWCFSFLILCQIKLAIERQGINKVENALKFFFLINASVTLFNLLKIVIEIRDINPYTFEAFNYKYFASTGDYLRGVTFDLSTVNNILNAFGLFYFLYRRSYLLSALCFLVSVFTTSNIGNFMLLFFFAGILILDPSKWHKSIVLCYIAFLVVFVVKISPSNLNYLNNKITSVFNLKNKPIQIRYYEAYSEKDKLVYNYSVAKHKLSDIKLLNENKIIAKLNVQEKLVKEKEKNLDKLYLKEEREGRTKFIDLFTGFYGDTLVSINQAYYEKYPGKLLSFFETFEALKDKPLNMAIGLGAGNFSSKLAFKATNIAISGKYVQKYVYIAPEFKANHLKLTLRYYLKSISEHSMLNFPNSVFNQLLGEYGLLGIVLFFGFYVLYFLKRFKKLSYGKLLLPLCLFFLLTDYWFESFTIVIIFEAMMFIDLATENNDKLNQPQEA